MPRLVSIVGSRLSEPVERASRWDVHTVYVVRISLGQGREAQRCRRYSTFRTLHAQMNRVARVPRFPAPRRFNGNSSTSRREREALLQAFLDDAVAAALESPAAKLVLAPFLGVEVEELTAGALTPAGTPRRTVDESTPERNTPVDAAPAGSCGRTAGVL